MELEKRNELINRHLPWVKKLAKERKRIARNNPQVSIEDLVAAGNRALVEAATKYQEDRGPFVAYAKRGIIGEMCDEVRKLTCHWSKIQPENTSLIYYENTANCDLFDVVAQALPNPQKGKEILRWYYADDMSLREIGDKLGWSKGRISQLLSYYKERIRERFTLADLV